MNAPQHIAIYMPSLGGGGAERIMVNLANALAERGHRVDLVLVKAEGPYLANVSDKVSVVDFKARGVLQSLPALVGYLRRQRPGSVLSVLSSANVVALLARIFSGIRFRLVVSERSTYSMQRNATSSLKERMYQLVIPAIYRLADAVVAVSRAAADDLVASTGIPPRLVTTIYNFVDIDCERFYPRAASPGIEQGSKTIFAAIVSRSVV